MYIPDLYTSGYKNLQLWSEYYTTVVTRMYRMYSGGHNNVQWWSEYYMAVVIYPEHVYCILINTISMYVGKYLVMLGVGSISRQ